MTLFDIMKKMNLKEGQLSNKVALVSGGGQGIGRSLCRALAWLGCQVIIAEVSDTGKETELSIQKDNKQGKFIHADIGKGKSILKLLKIIDKQYGRVDILVNNAIHIQAGEFQDFSLQDWDNTYKVNIRGAVQLIDGLLPGMLNRESGVIVNITSGEGLPYAAPYFATKSAVQSMALSLASELGNDSGVSVFVFGPGMVDTPGATKIFRKMAPMLNMTYQEFIHQGANPGYEGLLPVEHCAAGFADVIVNAKRYHGQVASPFPALNRADLSVQSEEEVISDKARQNQAKQDKVSEKSSAQKKSDERQDRNEPPAEPNTESGDNVDVNLESHIKESDIVRSTEEHHNQPAEPHYSSEVLFDKLVEILEAVYREYNNLGKFQKQWSLKNFQRRTGYTLDDWLSLARDMRVFIHQHSDSLDRLEATRIIQQKFRQWRDPLLKLAAYFQGLKPEAENYIKDMDQLKLAKRALDERTEKIEQLIRFMDEFLK